jgi:hypothetical protein
MIPKHSKYFEYLGDVVEDDYYKVELTQEGHSCQHDVLYRVFGNHWDKIARNGLRGDEDIKRQVSMASGKKGGSKKPSLETREKMRQAKLGRKQSEETKRKRSEALKGKKKPPRSEEHIQKISDSLKGNTRRKNGKKTYKTSEETKKKLSEAAKVSWKKRKGVL